MCFSTRSVLLTNELNKVWCFVGFVQVIAMMLAHKSGKREDCKYCAHIEASSVDVHCPLHTEISSDSHINITIIKCCRSDKYDTTFCFTQQSATNIQPHPETKICGSHRREYNNSLLGSDAMYFFFCMSFNKSSNSAEWMAVR
jgi:hypothetical protein